MDSDINNEKVILNTEEIYVVNVENTKIPIKETIEAEINIEKRTLAEIEEHLVIIENQIVKGKETANSETIQHTDKHDGRNFRNIKEQKE